ncbi:GNAT family N-acetyltransferase [Streptomyces sp. NPDC001910]|uniref:GNAT family N-acetyltransferase n=1 Tax=Streptomyces sp. NPDC001910 TaxID=3154403 RepID=UPI003333AA7E
MTITDSTVPLTGRHRIETITSIHAVEPETWNRVVAAAGGSIFHSWQWLAAYEDAPPGQAEPHHLLAWDNDELVAVCPAFLTHQCPRLTYLADLAELALGGPVLMAHSLAALDGGPLAAPGHGTAVPALLTALQHVARRLGAWAAAVANTPQGPLTGQLLRDSFATAHITTSYRCATQMPATSDYWAFADGRHRRKLIQERRAIKRRFTITEKPSDADTLVHLVHALLKDRSTPTDVLPEAFLRALHARLSPFERTLTAADDDQRTVALFASWQFASTWSVWLAGLDTSRLSGFLPYRALAADIIETAVHDGIRTVDLGRANAAQKRRLGARPTPLYLAIKTGDRRNDAALHAACRRLEERCQGPDDQLDMARRCC